MYSIGLLGYTQTMRRTTLDIDEDMLARAREILGTHGIKDTVDAALRETVRRQAGVRLMGWLAENEDLRNSDIMEGAWPRPPIS